jgi:cyclase
MKKITDRVYADTESRGSNPGFVVTSEGVVLIDTPVDIDSAKRWKKEMERFGKLRFLINTEHHLDHWLSNSIFDADVIAHEATRQTMLTMDLDYIRKRTLILYRDPLPIPENYKLKVPTVTYSKEMTLYIGGHTFRLIHTPGHTPGNTAVYIPEEKVVFTGDNLFGQTMTAFHDAMPKKWLEALGVIEKLDVQTIVPGHGKLCDKEYLKIQARIVKEMWEAEQKAKKENSPLTDAEKRGIDPYFDILDVGIKPGLVLPPTSKR